MLKIKQILQRSPSLILIPLCLLTSYAVWLPIAYISSKDGGVVYPKFLGILVLLFPNICAIAVCLFLFGFKKTVALVRRLLKPFSVKQAILILLLPITIASISICGYVLTGDRMLNIQGWVFYPLMLLIETTLVLFGEEFCLRGVMFEEFGKENALFGAVSVALVYALMRFPSLVTQGINPVSITFVSWFVWTIAISIMLTWAYKEAGKSILSSSLLAGGMQAVFQTFIISETSAVNSVALVWFYCVSLVFSLVFVIIFSTKLSKVEMPTPLYSNEK